MANTAMTPMQGFRQMLNSQGIATRLGEMMSPKRAARFKSQLLQIVTGDPKLQECDPMSIIGAAISAANIGLETSPAFGQAALVPFNNTVRMADGTTRRVRMAQLQIMTKGWTQLAMRSGRYEWINADAVYADEYRGSDLLSGMVFLEAVPGGFREQGRKDMIVGFFAAFRLTNGGQKVLYMTLHDLEVHARTYSKTYNAKGFRLPVPEGWKPDLYSTGIGWEKGWHAMARKTVLKLLIQRWGELSTEIEEALEADQAAFRGLDAEPEYVDNSGEIVTQLPEEEPEKAEEGSPEDEAPAFEDDDIAYLFGGNG